MNLSKNFSLSELIHSNTAKQLDFDNSPGSLEIANLKKLCTTVLQPLRDAVGSSITITSGYRSLMVNTAVHGERNSRHMQGKAADIKCATMSPAELAKLVIKLKLPVRYTKVYSSWLHVDIL